MSSHLGHIPILVEDYDEAIRFYRELGMEVIIDKPFGDMRLVSMAFPDQQNFKIVFQRTITEKEKQAVER